MQYKFYFNLNREKYATDFNELQAKVQKCAEYVFSEYSSLDKLYNKIILPILNGEVYLPMLDILRQRTMMMRVI